ncbi:MAG: LUD domain-containing protein [Firmicutes bacterium]|jgi:L-lactate utilization protein LutC|nr:LUD domain-containing protein [Bacillota bacterium]MCL5015395.1 LUD domain-containing protein [Bacillota bacterium]
MAVDEGILRRFEEEWQGNAGKIFHIVQAEELQTVLTDLADANGVSDQNPIVVSGLSEKWAQWIRTWNMKQVYIWNPEDDAEEFRHRCADASVGITGCAWAAADAGSVCLYSQKDSSLLPSLLPPVHVVMISAAQIVSTFREGMDRLYRDARQGGEWPALVKIVAGPSMTADIEGQLILGVHGPRDVYAVIVDN